MVEGVILSSVGGTPASGHPTRLRAYPRKSCIFSDIPGPRETEVNDFAFYS
jgi:hypothetical protein